MLSEEDSYTEVRAARSPRSGGHSRSPSGAFRRTLSKTKLTVDTSAPSQPPSTKSPSPKGDKSQSPAKSLFSTKSFSKKSPAAATEDARVVASPRTSGLAASAARIIGRSPKAAPAPKAKSLLENLAEKLKGALTAVNVAAAVVVVLAAALMLGGTEGPKLVKRDAPLRPGDTLNGGEYISFCTSVISFDCKPKYLLLSLDGELGVYSGSGPSDNRGHLWTSGTKTKGGRKHAFQLEYGNGKVVINKDGKMRWTSLMSRLPKNMQPWPFSP